MALLGTLGRLASRIKSGGEWYAILAAMGIVPGVPVVMAVYAGAPMDVLALYGVAGIAYWFVLANEGIPALAALLGRKRRQAISELVMLRQQGVSLRNRGIGSGPSEAESFHREFEAWQESVGICMRRSGVRATDIAWFETLDQVPNLEFGSDIDASIAKDLRELTEKLTRLQSVSSRFEG